MVRYFYSRDKSLSTIRDEYCFWRGNSPPIVKDNHFRPDNLKTMSTELIVDRDKPIFEDIPLEKGECVELNIKIDNGSGEY